MFQDMLALNEDFANDVEEYGNHNTQFAGIGVSFTFNGSGDDSHMSIVWYIVPKLGKIIATRQCVNARYPSFNSSEVYTL